MESKHPKALPWLTFSYIFFMAGFGGILASLVLYQTDVLKVSVDQAYGIFGAAMALFWIFPLGGGYLAAKFGYAHSAGVGLIFCALGLAVLSFQMFWAFYLGLALFVVGNGFATPSIWCMVDHCYSKTSDLRESGFTLFYLFFNLGGIFGIFFGGFLASVFSFSFEFAFDALCLFISFCVFQIAAKKMVPHKGRTVRPQLEWEPKKLLGSAILISAIAVPIAMFLFQNITINNILTVLLFLSVTGVLIGIGLKQKQAFARNQMFAFISLVWIGVIFWTLYSLEPSFLSVFVEHNVDRHFLGIDIPAASFLAFDGVFVFLIGLILSRVWVILSKRRQNLSLPTKFSSSLIIIGCGFCLLALAIHLGGPQLLPGRYIVFAYAFFAFAELLIGPLGTAMVGRLAPEGWEGLMMGFWQLSVGLGGVVAAYVAMFPHLPSHAEPLSISNPVYFATFFAVGLISLFAGLLAFLFKPKLKQLIVET